MNFLRDPIWQFIGATIALAALLISILPFVIARKRKAIAYYFFSSTPLSAEDDDKLRIVYDGKPVENVGTVFVRLYNSGNLPIQPDEFYSPVTIRFGGESQILRVRYAAYPSPFDMAIEVQSNTLSLAPVMLNKRDGINIHALVAGFDGKVDVSARVTGVPRIKGFDMTDKFRDEESRQFRQYPVIAETIMAMIGSITMYQGGVFRVFGAYLTGLYFANEARKIFGKRISTRFYILLEILLPFLVFGLAVAIAHII
ncbi:MAG: hypothetical protein M3458_03645 [Acidobacteriota bacterium]|nr:hypothetical protein [Acidobacteriota bacterium]